MHHLIVADCHPLTRTSRDVPFNHPRDLPDVFTTYRKMVEPLRDAPRKQLAKPDRLQPLPDHIPPQARPFTIPSSYDAVLAALTKPLGKQPIDIPEPPQLSNNAKSAHPFVGGSKSGHERIQHLIDTGSMTAYKDTRNGLLGLDFSTKLSAWLAMGCISSRQVHWQLVDFEDGKGTCGKSADGYGKGESKVRLICHLSPFPRYAANISYHRAAPQYDSSYFGVTTCACALESSACDFLIWADTKETKMRGTSSSARHTLIPRTRRTGKASMMRIQESSLSASWLVAQVQV